MYSIEKGRRNLNINEKYKKINGNLFIINSYHEVNLLLNKYLKIHFLCIHIRIRFESTRIYIADEWKYGSPYAYLSAKNDVST